MDASDDYRDVSDTFELIRQHETSFQRAGVCRHADKVGSHAFEPTDHRVFQRKQSLKPRRMVNIIVLSKIDLYQWGNKFRARQVSAWMKGIRCRDSRDRDE